MAEAFFLKPAIQPESCCYRSNQLNVADDISQGERRRIMADDRRARTYFGQAQHTDEDLYGGRFKQVTTTNVVGSGPISYPQQPTGSPWAKDECPPEPSLGYSVDAMQPVGEPHEIAASIEKGEK